MDVVPYGCNSTSTKKTYDKDLTDLIETISGICIYQIRTGFIMHVLISRIILSEALLGNPTWIHHSIKKISGSADLNVLNPNPWKV